jgi:hypothetical protein
MKKLFCLIFFFSFTAFAENSRSPAVLDGSCNTDVPTTVSEMINGKEVVSERAVADILKDQCKAVKKCMYSANEEDMDELNDLVNELEETNFDTDVINIKEDGNNFDFLKTIHIANLEEESDTNKLDYKKYSLNKLRNIVVEKGLVTDSSKLKKPDLYKLLGIE